MWICWPNSSTHCGQHLRVPVALDTKRCISCTHPYTWSFAGRFQHCKTGLCETCWCVLAKSPSVAKNNEALSVCDRLKEAQGCEFMYQWLTVTNCMKVDQLIEYAKFEADYISSIVAGTVALPDIWRTRMSSRSLRNRKSCCRLDSSEIIW